jgi:hypothetical protein
MALNPVAYTEKVVRSFLKYQLSTYPFADADFHSQMRTLLSLDHTRRTPLMKGPYVSLSRPFREGASIASLAGQGVLHTALSTLVSHPNLYGHQEAAVRAIHAGKHTLVSTGTGSGKTECFLYPIISKCLELKDQKAAPGISAVLVYPMNALAEDQLGRLRELLAGTGITFAMYVGKTPENKADVPGQRMRPGASRADYRAALKKAQDQRQEVAVHPAEEHCSREELREPGGQPRILLTNVKMLELLLTRQKDVELFDSARLDFLVFDEAHTFAGAQGAETACLVRRLRAFCAARTAAAGAKTVCVATSATIADPSGGGEAPRDFARRFFGVPKDDVAIVGEVYEAQGWGQNRRDPGAPSGKGGAVEVLKDVLKAVDVGDSGGAMVSDALKALTGTGLAAERQGDWRDALYDALLENEVAYRLTTELLQPRPLDTVVHVLDGVLKRAVSEEEVLAYLALGAAARKQGRALLRPVIHSFVRGVGGAVVTFPETQTRPKLWLSAEDAAAQQPTLAKFPVLTCSTCGQHYFEHHAAGWEFVAKAPGGGEAVEERCVWRPQDASTGGKRLVVTDTVISADDGDDDPPKTARVHFCRACGAVHPQGRDRCDACAAQGRLVELIAVQEKDERPGHLTRCVSCGQGGRLWNSWYREPARPVRAVPVADVHVLAQDMVQHAERRRLLIFADNRQEAAFQAGWMRDHARRFRLRSLMYERITQGPVSVGDLTKFLDDRLEHDDDLSRMLVPEVWQVAAKEAAGTAHVEERKYFLRIQVLREIVTGIKQRVGLEPWGRLRVDYLNLSDDHPWIKHEAAALAVDPSLLADGISDLLDRARRAYQLHDSQKRIFGRFWGDGDFELQRGYLPDMVGIPKAVKLTRDPGDEPGRVAQWLSAKGETTARAAVKKWGVAPDKAAEFLQRLWSFLADDLKILVPVTLVGQRGNALPGCAGARQVDGDKIRLVPSHGLWRCRTCRRAQTRTTPRGLCQAFRCDGVLVREDENPDSYDLDLLDHGSHMVRAREHSAMVPAFDRDLIERQFKGDGEQLNTLVCTPTLELGVDIGALDAVLMRNVPPLPANYWQRVGRAGRRQRMAVDLTYARPTTHDRFYFNDPQKMLAGRVDPPRFNLRNPLMVGRHVNAAVLTRLRQLARPGSPISEGDRTELTGALVATFPSMVKSFLFEADGKIRTTPFDASPFRTVVSKHRADLLQSVKRSFATTWPSEDRAVIDDAVLESATDRTPEELERVVGVLRRRLAWALSQLDRLEAKRKASGTLDEEDKSLYQRCDRLVRRMKGQDTRGKGDAEGYDDVETYGVLAAEGFLPGYGLESGSVRAVAQLPRWQTGSSDFVLPRPPAVALREYVPGNLIYANGNRFVARYFQLLPQEPAFFDVNVESETATEVAGAGNAAGNLGAASLPAVPVCDVQLTHRSHISDEEDFRFQMPVTTFGTERGRHEAGMAFAWGERAVHFRKGVHLRLVNVGPARKVEENELGYPVCQVCGQSRTPFASVAELDKFGKDHAQRCGKPPVNVGFYADIVADALSLPMCADKTEAYSLAEAIRTGATRVLDMERDDLQVLVLGTPGSEESTAILFDPMPGGSGLLEQLCERFPEIIQAIRPIVSHCPSGCERSCSDCLRTFRNAFYHASLDRHLVEDVLSANGDALRATHPIPAKMPDAAPKGDHRPVNVDENRLREQLMRAGFPEARRHEPIDLGQPLGKTYPDCMWPGSDPTEPGICLYLDGLSDRLHGNPVTAERDRVLREALRAKGYEVFELPASCLDDRGRMTQLFYDLGLRLLDRDRAKSLRANPTTWFDSAAPLPPTAP